MINLLPVQNYHFSTHLKEFATKPNVSTIEKTARIAAAIFLALPAILLDLGIETLRAFCNLSRSLMRNDDANVYQYRPLEPSAPPISLSDQLVPPLYDAPEELPRDFGTPPPYSY